MNTTIGCPIPGASQPIQLDENNNIIDPVTGKLMHQLTVEEMPSQTFGAELYAPDAVRPTAHWINRGYVCGENEYECSACHQTEWRTSASRMKYCMFCGARMEGCRDE